jgi:hypothetical protein
MEGSPPRDPRFQGVRSRPAFLFVLVLVLVLVLEDLWVWPRIGPIGPMGLMCSAWVLAGAAGGAVIKGLRSDQTVEHEDEQEHEHDVAPLFTHSTREMLAQGRPLTFHLSPSPLGGTNTVSTPGRTPNRTGVVPIKIPSTCTCNRAREKTSRRWLSNVSIFG